MNVTPLTEDIRTYLQEKFADQFVSECDQRVLEQICWNTVFQQCQEWTDSELIAEIELHCPEVLTLAKCDTADLA